MDFMWRFLSLQLTPIWFGEEGSEWRTKNTTILSAPMIKFLPLDFLGLSQRIPQKNKKELS